MKPAARPDGRLRMRDLTKRTGLPSSTIHLYMRMGLLPKPVKTSHNQALYDEDFVERLLLVRSLHTQADMPLSTIRDTLRKLPDRGAFHKAAAGFDETLHAFVETLRQGPEPAASEFVSRKDLVAEGIESADLDTLIRLKLIAPAPRLKPQKFSRNDVRIARAFSDMKRAFAPVHIETADGLIAIIAAFVRYLTATARAEAHELTRLLLDSVEDLSPGEFREDLIRSTMIARDELISAIHWKELASALEALAKG